MALLNYTLFVNVDDQLLLPSANGGSAVQLPILTVGDCINLRIQLLNRVGSPPTQSYAIVAPSSFTLKVGIGTLGGSPLAYQNTWTATSDQFLMATFDLTSAGLASAVAAGSVLYFEIEVTESGCISTVYQGRVTVRQATIPSTVTNPTPSDSYRTSAESDATYARRVGLAGQTIQLLSPDGTKGLIIGVNNDGTMQTDYFTP